MFALFFFVWLILNSRVTLEICLLGVAVSSALYYFICRYMDYNVKKELLVWRLTPHIVRYFGVLVKEIVKANVDVLHLILSPRVWPEPQLVYFKSGLNTGLARVMLANSITLTPGTITVSVDEDTFCIHCLDKEFAEGLNESVFIHMLREMEEKENAWS